MNLHKIIFWLCILGLLLFGACQNKQADVYTQDTHSPTGGIQVVVEIPAGTNHKIEFQPSSQQFVNDSIAGKERIINFLPYPGNYGFIPSTMMDKKRGGDGDALDVLVIGESVPTGQTIATRPIGVLMLRDKGEMDSKIIAIPADSTLQVINPKDYEDFFIRYNAAHHIIQEWFMNYKGLGVMELVSWQDEQYALREIEKWQMSNE